MTWEQATTIASQMDTGGKYIKLKDKESIELVFMGEPYVYKQAFDKATRKSVEYDPEQHDRNDDVEVSTRFSFDVAVVRPTNTGGYTVDPDLKKFEVGVSVFRQILALHTKKRLSKSSFEVTRNGEGMQTKYSIMQERSVDEEFAAQLRAVRQRSAQSSAPAPTQPAQEQDADDLPF